MVLRGRGKPLPYGRIRTLSYVFARYRNVTTWARVHFPVGLNVVGVLPVVISFSSAQRTAL